MEFGLGIACRLLGVSRRYLQRLVSGSRTNEDLLQRYGHFACDYGMVNGEPDAFWAGEPPDVLMIEDRTMRFEFAEDLIVKGGDILAAGWYAEIHELKASVARKYAQAARAATERLSAVGLDEAARLIRDASMPYTKEAFERRLAACRLAVVHGEEMTSVENVLREVRRPLAQRAESMAHGAEAGKERVA